MRDPIITIQQGRGAWQGPQSEAPRCRKCGAVMAPGIAMAQTYTGSPDDLGGDVVTMSPGGSGNVVSCRKCKECGWSVTGAAPQEAEPVALTYRNWRGEVAERTIIPRRVWFGATDWHPEPQWLLTAFDTEKGADLDFALKDFGQPALAPAAPVETGLRESLLKWCDERQFEVVNCLDLRAHEEAAAVSWLENFRAAVRAQQPAPQVKALEVPDGLIEALRRGEQADMDGTMVKVSRQACEMAADILSALSGEAQR